MYKIDLNSDIGESFGAYCMGDDEAVMDAVTSANVACGFHAGDPLVMKKTIKNCAAKGVAVGAHPGYPDLVGFGRRNMKCTPEEEYADCLYQIGALSAFCRTNGLALQHVKPHGAMYNDMMASPEQLRAVVHAVATYDARLPLMLMATRDNREAQAIGDEYGVTLWFEAFADRAYDNAGRLVSRQLPGAVHHDADTIVRQALTLAAGQSLIASDGSALYLHANTLCVHGDNASSVAAVQRIRNALNELQA